MRGTRFFVLSAGIAGALYAVGQAPNLSQMDVVLRSVPDGPVAKVNNVNITRLEFAQLYQAKLIEASQLSGKDVPDGARVELGLWTLGTLIEQELIYQEGLKRKIRPDSAMYDQAYKSQMKVLAAMRNLKPEEVEAKLSEDERKRVREEVERAIVVDTMRETILNEKGVAVSDAEIKTEFEKNKQSFTRPETLHLKQITFPLPKPGPGAEKKRAAVRKAADNALAAMRSGKSFEGVLKDVSGGDNPGQGGDMGPVPVAQLPPPIAEAASKLQPGAFSGVIEGEFGLHIIQLIEAGAGAGASIKDAEPFIRRKLAAQRGEEAVRTYCDNLIANGADVKVYLELEKTLRLDPKYRELLKD